MLVPSVAVPNVAGALTVSLLTTPSPYLSPDLPAAVVAVAVSGVAVAAVVHLDELMWLFGGSPR